MILYVVVGIVAGLLGLGSIVWIVRDWFWLRDRRNRITSEQAGAFIERLLAEVPEGDDDA